MLIIMINPSIICWLQLTSAQLHILIGCYIFVKQNKKSKIVANHLMIFLTITKILNLIH